MWYLKIINKKCRLLFLMLSFIAVFLSQTESATVSFLKNIIEKQGSDELFLPKGKTLDSFMPEINKLIEKEKEFADTHYVFYNAGIPEFIFLQDLYKQLKSNIDHEAWTDFEFIRPKSQMYGNFDSITDFFEWKDKKGVETHDKSDHNTIFR